MGVPSPFRLWCAARLLFRLWASRSFARCQLATLDERALRDMRLTRRALREELRKPFWRA